MVKEGKRKEGGKGEWERREGGREGQVKTCLYVCVHARVCSVTWLCFKKAQETKEVSAEKGKPRLWVVMEKAGRLLRCQVSKVCGGRCRTGLNSVSDGKKCYL